MSELDRFWQLVQLAQASYAGFQDLSQESVRLGLGAQSLSGNIFSKTQATRLIDDAAGFSVADISANANDPVGFSATLFCDNRAGGGYVLALRGTEPGTPADREHSIYEIAVWGVAANQIVSAYNYFQRLITPKGQAVKQLILEERATPPSDSIPSVAVPSVVPGRGFLYLTVRSYYADNAIGTLADLPPGTTISLTGHSLGGHLAQALLRLFPQWFEGAYVYNTAGFDPAFADPFFRLIDPQVGAIDQTRITNVYSYPRPEIVTNTIFHTQYGQRLGVWIEDQLPDITGNHSIAVQGHSLAVHALFAAIDPSFGATPQVTEPAFPGIDAILKAVSPSQKLTLPAALGSLAKLFLQQDSQPEALVGLEAFYERLFAVRDAIAGYPAGLHIESLVGLSAATLESRAVGPDGGAYTYALQTLNPFAVIGAGYDAHRNAGLALDLFDATSGTGELTTEWLRDRSQFLYWRLVANRDDLPGIGVNPDGAPMQFVDRRVVGGKPVEDTLYVGTSFIKPRTLAFGSALADLSEGSGYADGLYGAAGNDRLFGYGGDDYLQGDAGADHLNGGAGNDTLVGGKDTDVMIGGKEVLPMVTLSALSLRSARMNGGGRRSKTMRREE